MNEIPRVCLFRSESRLYLINSNRTKSFIECRWTNPNINSHYYVHPTFYLQGSVVTDGLGVTCWWVSWHQLRSRDQLVGLWFLRVLFYYHDNCLFSIDHSLYICIMSMTYRLFLRRSNRFSALRLSMMEAATQDGFQYVRQSVEQVEAWVSNHSPVYCVMAWAAQ